MTRYVINLTPEHWRDRIRVRVTDLFVDGLGLVGFLHPAEEGLDFDARSAIDPVREAILAAAAERLPTDRYGWWSQLMRHGADAGSTAIEVEIP